MKASVAIQDQLKTITIYRSISINILYSIYLSCLHEMYTQNKRFNFFSHSFGKI